MIEKADLPPLTQSCLDECTLEALLDDLSSLTEILEVTVKGGEFDRAEKTSLALRPAVKALQAGLVRGVQRHGQIGQAAFAKLPQAFFQPVSASASMKGMVALPKASVEVRATAPGILATQ